MKKKIPPIEPKKEWKTVADMDIKYESISFPVLLQWVMDNVPKGTKLEDIQISFEIDDSTGYYDDVIIEAHMILSVYS